MEIFRVNFFSIFQKKARVESKKKLDVWVITSVKDEEPYLLEWIAHYTSIGFTKFLFYTNDNNDSTLELLNNLQSNGDGLLIVYENFLKEGEKPQAVSYQRALDVFKQYSPDWVLCCDIDEFLVLEQHNNVQDFLSDHPDADAIAFNWKHFGSGGRKLKGDGMTVERFVMRANTEFVHNRMIKSMYRFTENIAGFGPHRPWFNDTTNISYMYPGGRPVPESFIKHGGELGHIEGAYINHSIGSMHHYAIRSEEEFINKKKRGKGTVGALGNSSYSDKYFLARDVNEVVDLSALKNIDQVKKEYQRLKELCELKPSKDEV